MKPTWAMLSLAITMSSIAAPAAEHDARVLAEFATGREGRLIILPVTIDGQPYPFVVDTGTTDTVYDSALRSHLGEPLGTTGAQAAGGSIIQMTRFRSIPAKLGQLSVQTDDSVSSWNLEPLRQAAGLDVRGVLGMTVFRKHLVQIDFDAGTFTILAPAAKPDPAWGTAVPMEYHPKLGIPLVIATVTENTSYPFVVDMGMIGTGNLSHSLFVHLFNQGALTPAGESSSTGATGDQDNRLGWLKALQIGTFRHPMQCFGEGGPCALGLDYWSRYGMTFDFPNKTLYLKKGNRFDERDRQELSGIKLKWEDKKVVVRALRYGSPGSRSGLKPGDVVMTIQGKPAESYEFFELFRHLFVAEGRRIDMTVKRGDETIPVSFVLEPRSQTWPKPQSRPEGPGDDSKDRDRLKDLPDSFRLPVAPPASGPAGDVRFR